MEKRLCLEKSGNLDILDFLMEKSWNFKKQHGKLKKISINSLQAIKTQQFHLDNHKKKKKSL